MALLNSLGLSSYVRKGTHLFTPLWTQFRGSKYPTTFLEPTFRKEDLSAELEPTDPRKFQPIKAAQNEQTSLTAYDELVAKFIRILLKEGNKERARLIVHKTFENLKLMQIEKYHKAKTDIEREMIELDPKKIFSKAVDNCRPILLIQRVKRGGVMYQVLQWGYYCSFCNKYNTDWLYFLILEWHRLDIAGFPDIVPVPAKPKHQTFLAMKWLIEAGDEKHRSVRVWDKLPFELLDAYNNEGKSVRKKQDLHRICEANRAYAHFRW